MQLNHHDISARSKVQLNIIVNPFQKDKVFLETGVSELKDYLLSKEIYWPIGARGLSLPRLTIGGILLAQARLQARDEKVAAYTAELERMRIKWKVAWENKVIREFKARMRLWSNYFMDYRHDPEQHADAYPYEVRNRVILSMIFMELDKPPSERIALVQLDNMLRANLLASEFIWEAELQPGFSRDEYWYLYGKLKI